MDFTQLFLEGIKGIGWFDEGLGIVKHNSEARIWLIGGAVYRSIAKQLYGTPIPGETDLDFIVEKPTEKLDVPAGWEIRKTRFNAPRLVNGVKQIDLVPLADISLMRNRSIKYTIEKFLTATSLTIQSIAYDVYGNKVIGEIGMDSLKRRVVEINDPDIAEYTASMVGKSAEETVRKKADSLGFKAVFNH